MKEAFDEHAGIFLGADPNLRGHPVGMAPDSKLTQTPKLKVDFTHQSSILLLLLVSLSSESESMESTSTEIEVLSREHHGGSGGGGGGVVFQSELGG